jgi:hypothetical protein
MQGPILSKLVDGHEIDKLSVHSSKNNGIISNSFEHLFEAISVAHDIRYLVVVSYLEIYNENIRDLLNNDTQNNLKLKENPTEGVVVENLSRHPVQNMAECEQLLLFGTKNRKVGATLMNGELDELFTRVTFTSIFPSAIVQPAVQDLTVFS